MNLFKKNIKLTRCIKYTKTTKLFLANFNLFLVKYIKSSYFYLRKNVVNYFQRSVAELKDQENYRIGILEKYVFKEFGRNFILVLLILFLIISVRLFIKLLGYVVEGKFDINMVFEILLLSTSKSLILFLPFIITISLVITISKLHQDNEAYVMRSSGCYLSCIKKISFLIFIPFFILITILNLSVSPHIYETIEKTKIKAASEAQVGILSPGKFMQIREKGWIIFVEGVDGKKAKKIFLKTDEGDRVSIETAKYASENLKDDIRELILINGQRYSGNIGTGDFQVLKYDQHKIKLINSNPDFSSNHRMMTLSDLFSENTNKARAEIEWRFFAPLSLIFLVLLASKLGEMKPRQNKYSNIILTVLIYFLYSNLTILSVNQIKQDSNLFLNIGTYWVHLLFLFIVIYFFNKEYFFNKFYKFLHLVKT